MRSERLLTKLGVLAAAMALVAMTATSALSAGFALYEWSARGVAMGGAVMGSANDPSALAYNPAGITQLDGTHVAVGGSMILHGGKMNTRYGTQKDSVNIKDAAEFPPHIFATHKFNDNVSMGLAIFTRFGLGNEYPDDWQGRYGLTKVQLNSVSMQPTLAVEVIDGLSLAVGLELQYMWAEQKKDIDATALGVAIGTLPPSELANYNNPNTTDRDVKWKMKGDGIAPGGVFALHYRPIEEVGIGVSYRTPMTQNMQGRSFFEPSAGAQAVAPGFYSDTDTALTLELPDSLAFGVSYKPIEKLNLEAAAVLTFWSRYREIRYDFDKPSVGRTEVVSKKDWMDAWRLAFAAEYDVFDWMTVRGSYVYDNSPINGVYDDYMLPSGDRQIISGGLGFKYDAWTLDLAYSYLWMKGRQFEEGRIAEGIMPGNAHDGYAHIAAVTLGYAF